MPKGNVTDIIFIITIIIVSGITIIFSYYILNRVSSITPTTNFNNSAMVQGLVAINYLDYAIASLFIGLAIFSIISAFLVRSHPILLAGGIVTLALVTILSAQISNIMYDITQSSTLSSTSSAFPITTLILQNLPIEAAIIGFIILIAFFAKGDQNAQMY